MVRNLKGLYFSATLFLVIFKMATLGILWTRGAQSILVDMTQLRNYLCYGLWACEATSCNYCCGTNLYWTQTTEILGEFENTLLKYQLIASVVQNILRSICIPQSSDNPTMSFNSAIIHTSFEEFAVLFLLVFRSS